MDEQHLQDQIDLLTEKVSTLTNELNELRKLIDALIREDHKAR